MTVTKDDGLYFNGVRASENPRRRKTEEKTGVVGKWVDAIHDLRIKGLTSWHVVRDFTIRRINPLKLRTHSLLWCVDRDEAISGEGKFLRKSSDQYDLFDYCNTLKFAFVSSFLKHFLMRKSGSGSR